MESVVGRGTLLAGRYRTLQPLASDLAGASSWEATDQILDRPVRVTVLHGGHVPQALDAARRAALVTDPRLVRVLDVGEHEGVSYTVTEQVSGPSLAELVARGPLPADQARAIVGEAAAALEAARRRGVHHLTLRPSVLHLTPDDRVLLTGLAVDGALLGREIHDAEAATRADTVGLVRLLYAALTGRWPGASPGAAGPLPHLAAAPVLEGAPVPPAELASGVPNDLDTLCAVTLGVHDDGPQTPAQLVQELEPWGDIRATDLFAGTQVLPVLPPAAPTTPVPTVDVPATPARVQRTSVRSMFAGGSTAMTPRRPGTPPPAVPSRSAAFTGPVVGAPSVGTAAAAGAAGRPVPDDAPTTALPATRPEAPRPPSDARRPASPPAGAAPRTAAPATPPADAPETAPRTAPQAAPQAAPQTAADATAADSAVTAALPNPAAPTPGAPASAPSTASSPAPATAADAAETAALPNPAVPATGAPATAPRATTSSGPTAPAGASAATPPRRPSTPSRPAAASARPASAHPASAHPAAAAPVTPAATPPPAAAPVPPADPHAAPDVDRDLTPDLENDAAPELDRDVERGAGERPPLLPLGPRVGGLDVAGARETIAAHRFDPTRFVLLLVALAIVIGLFSAYRALTRPVDLSADAPEPVATQTEPAQAPAEEEPAGEEPEPEPDAEEPPAPPVIASAQQLDPPPDGDQNEHPEAVPRAIDGDPATAWFTRTYNDPTFGGLKTGVGYAVTLAEPTTVSTVTLQVLGTGGRVEVRATDPATPTEGAVLAEGVLGPETVLTLSEPTETQNVVLWFTELPQTSDGSNRIELAEVTLS